MSWIRDFAQRWPLIFTGVWFMLATLIVAVLTTATAALCGTSITLEDIVAGIILPSIAAFLGGAVWGHRIIAPALPISRADAAGRGIATGFISYAIHTFMAMSTDGGMLIIIFVLYGLVLLCIPIAIVGAAAGWGLHLFAERQGIVIDRSSES